MIISLYENSKHGGKFSKFDNSIFNPYMILFVLLI
jgi:hypothetical protein